MASEVSIPTKTMSPDGIPLPYPVTLSGIVKVRSFEIVDDEVKVCFSLSYEEAHGDVIHSYDECFVQDGFEFSIIDCDACSPWDESLYWVLMQVKSTTPEAARILARYGMEMVQPLLDCEPSEAPTL